MSHRFHSIHTHGFVRAAVCTPPVTPGDPGANAAAINFPDAHEDQFKGVVDVVSMKYITYADADGLEMIVSEIPAHLKAKADEMHHILIEKVGEGLSSNNTRLDGGGKLSECLHIR